MDSIRRDNAQNHHIRWNLSRFREQPKNEPKLTQVNADEDDLRQFYVLALRSNKIEERVDVYEECRIY